jgi:hypothetical protein
MTRRHTALLTVLLVASLFGAVGCGSSTKDLMKLQKGMEAADVEILLGKPLATRKVVDFSYWDYKVGGEKWTINFEGERVLGKTKNAEEWGKSF